MIKNCLICTNKFTTYPSEIKRGWGKYCSQRCLGDHRKQVGYAPPSRTGATPWNKGLKGFLAGELSNFWKGGVSKINKTARQLAMETIEYKTWRKAIFERDGYACVWCKAKSGAGTTVILNADHIKPWSLFPKQRYNVANGRTLCLSCHKKTPSYNLNQYSMKGGLSASSWTQ
jgi:hypothetical protein